MYVTSSPSPPPQDFANIPVVGTSLALREVADVVEAHQPLIGDAVLKDGPGLLLVVEKYPGFNTVEVTQGVEAALAELRSGMTGIDVDTTIYRPASFIERATGNLSSAISIAAVLALVALVALLGSWRATLVAAASITMSLAAAVFVFYLRGVDFNMMVVAGLLMAIAVVVDDAIVDADNIRRRLREAGDGEARPIWRIIAGASVEIRGPMLYATLISVIAVAPLLLMQGLSAAFFRPLAMVLHHRRGGLPGGRDDGHAGSGHVAVPAGAGGATGRLRILDGLQRLYGRLAGSAILSPVAAWTFVAGGVLVAILVWSQLERSLIPSFKETDVFVEVQAPPGASLQAMDRITATLIHDLRAVPGVRNAAAQIGRALLSHDNRRREFGRGLGKPGSQGRLRSHAGSHAEGRRRPIRNRRRGADLPFQADAREPYRRGSGDLCPHLRRRSGHSPGQGRGDPADSREDPGDQAAAGRAAGRAAGDRCRGRSGEGPGLWSQAR